MLVALGLYAGLCKAHLCTTAVALSCQNAWTSAALLTAREITLTVCRKVRTKVREQSLLVASGKLMVLSMRLRQRLTYF